MALKEELEAMLAEDQKKLKELKERVEELQKTIESEETILNRKFGTRFSRGNEATSKNASNADRFMYKTIPDAAFEVILEGGNKPIHLKEIFRKVNEGGKLTSQPSSIGVALRRHKRFKLVGPNVFAIVDEEYRKAKEGV